MPIEPENEETALPETSSEGEGISDPASKEIIGVINTASFLPSQTPSLLPSQAETGGRLEDRQETTRSQLATFLIYILGGTLIASFILILILIIMSRFTDDSRKNIFDQTSSLVKDLITFILTAQTGLIGTALGFYFGSRSNNAN